MDRTELWTQISAVDRYRLWWPWLRGFDAQALADGDVWRCVVQPPLPYAVRFAVAIDDVDIERSVTTTITGDVVGSGRLDIVATDEGCEVRLTSVLRPNKLVLRIIGAVARPAAQYGHRWVLDTGARQFAERAQPSSR